MLQNVIELGKSEFGEAPNKILRDIFVRNVEKKGIDNQVNTRTEDPDGNNKDNDCEEGKETCYLNDSIKQFISRMLIKQGGKKRTIITQSLYKLLGLNIFHKDMSAFAHDFAEEIEVGFMS